MSIHLHDAIENALIVVDDYKIHLDCGNGCLTNFSEWVFEIRKELSQACDAKLKELRLSPSDIETMVDAMEKYKIALQHLEGLWKMGIQEQEKQWKKLPVHRWLARRYCNSTRSPPFEQCKSQLKILKKRLESNMQFSQDEEWFQGYRMQLIRLSMLVPTVAANGAVLKKFQLST